MFKLFKNKSKEKEKIIIGIHGLGNKPPEDLLREWWFASLKEGLAKVTKENIEFNFELVYWADVTYSKPLDPTETDETSEYFLDERYLPESENTKEEEKTIKQNMVQYFKDQLNQLIFNEKLHFHYPAVTDFVISHFFKDLAVYFTENCAGEGLENCLIREVIKEKLLRTIEKHKDKEILLIAHSMGTIVAYDVLSSIENEPSVEILVTCASPLGVPFIYNKIKHEQGISEKAFTPNSIKKDWFNLADLNDKIAVNFELDSLFLPNKNGVKPEPLEVVNTYEFNGIKNPHKSYGYLRTPEMAGIIVDFLTQPVKQRAVKGFLQRVKEKMKIFGKGKNE